jgi:hypothetical protein
VEHVGLHDHPGLYRVLDDRERPSRLSPVDLEAGPDPAERDRVPFPGLEHEPITSHSTLLSWDVNDS